MLNLWFGGVHTMSNLLRRVAQQRHLKELSWVDVAGGEGYVATQTQQSLARSGTTVASSDSGSRPHTSQQDASCCVRRRTALPFRDNSFDAVGCSLFLHHLEPDEIVSFAREGLRVARHAFLIHDLRRHPMHLDIKLPWLASLPQPADPA